MSVKRSLLSAVFFVFCTIPVIAMAQSPDWLNSVINGVASILPGLIAVLIGVALLFFIWGLIVFITKSGDENAVAEGKVMMFWGVIALFVIVSVWGIVLLLQQIVGVQGLDIEPVVPTTRYP